MIYEKFVNAFQDYKDCYCIIGGNAATILLNEDLYDSTKFEFRKTQDYDIVIISELKNTGFSRRFLEFLQNNEYWDNGSGTNSDGEHYYRFKTNKTDVPKLIETFSHPELKFPLKLNNNKTPVPEGDDPSLSAILLDKDYYKLLKEGITIRDNLPILDVPYLIFFKAKAHIDISQENNKHLTNHKDIHKHFNDVCQLALLVTTGMLDKIHTQNIPISVKNDMKQFIDVVKNTDDTTFKQKFRNIPDGVRPKKPVVLQTLESLI